MISSRSSRRACPASCVQRCRVPCWGSPGRPSRLPLGRRGARLGLGRRGGCAQDTRTDTRRCRVSARAKGVSGTGQIGESRSDFRSQRFSLMCLQSLQSRDTEHARLSRTPEAERPSPTSRRAPAPCHCHAKKSALSFLHDSETGRRRPARCAYFVMECAPSLSLVLTSVEKLELCRAIRLPGTTVQ